MKTMPIRLASLLTTLLLVVTTTPAAERTSPGGNPGGNQLQMKIPFSPEQVNRTPVRVQPQTMQAKLQAAMTELNKSKKDLKIAVDALRAFYDRKTACVGKSWTAQEMEKLCGPKDTVESCKEKLVAACAAGPGSNEKQLWETVRTRTKDVSNKAMAINALSGNIIDWLPPNPGITIPSF